MKLFQLLATAFTEAFQAMRAKPLHTILSLLGIIIGVGALISILALGDGMEKFGREQIAKTTDLNSIQITAETHQIVDGIRMLKKNTPALALSDMDSIEKSTPYPITVNWISYSKSWVKLVDDSIPKPTNVLITLPSFFESTDTLLHGEWFSSNKSEKQIIINEFLAKRLTKDTLHLSTLIHQEVLLDSISYMIKGIAKLTKDNNKQSNAIVPAWLIASEKLNASPSFILVSADKLEQLPDIKRNIETYYSTAPHKKEDYRIASNEYRVNQLRRGILLFKSIMGLIVGISILVGGIGIMNVLLMSVTERTREIGIRKALGAKPNEIAMQFMAEAMTISLMGSVMGILFGMGTLAIALPILQKILQGDIIKIAYSPVSIFIIMIIAILIGLVFGTYPAYKASKQSPIDAIRVE